MQLVFLKKKYVTKNAENSLSSQGPCTHSTAVDLDSTRLDSTGKSG